MAEVGDFFFFVKGLKNAIFVWARKQNALLRTGTGNVPYVRSTVLIIPGFVKGKFPALMEKAVRALRCY